MNMNKHEYIGLKLFILDHHSDGPMKFNKHKLDNLMMIQFLLSLEWENSFNLDGIVPFSLTELRLIPSLLSSTMKIVFSNPV